MRRRKAGLRLRLRRPDVMSHMYASEMPTSFASRLGVIGVRSIARTRFGASITDTSVLLRTCPGVSTGGTWFLLQHKCAYLCTVENPCAREEHVIDYAQLRTP
jgi:hypothetical protein